MTTPTPQPRALPRRQIPRLCPNAPDPNEGHYWLRGRSEIAIHLPAYLKRHQPPKGAFVLVVCRDCEFGYHCQDRAKPPRGRERPRGRCLRCAESLPPREAGLRGRTICDTCKRANTYRRNRQWNQLNPERLREYRRAYKQRQRQKEREAA
jgi:hypothetical protein